MFYKKIKFIVVMLVITVVTFNNAQANESANGNDLSQKIETIEMKDLIFQVGERQGGGTTNNVVRLTIILKLKNVIEYPYVFSKLNDVKEVLGGYFKTIQIDQLSSSNDIYALKVNLKNLINKCVNGNKIEELYISDIIAQ